MTPPDPVEPPDAPDVPVADPAEGLPDDVRTGDPHAGDDAPAKED